MQTKKTTDKADAPAEVRAQHETNAEHQHICSDHGIRYAECGHTPGPWQMVGTAIMKKIGPQNDSWMDICEISNINLGNARLIAAAPDMLAALQALFRECSMVHKYWGDGCNQEQSDAAIAAALAAIARAEGSAT